MIDPLETVVQYLKTKTVELGTGQIASKHKYGGSWAPGSKAITVRWDGGPSDRYVPVHNIRLEVRFYGANQVEVLDLALAMISLSRSTEREVVATESGNALLQYLLRDSGLSQLYDDQLSMDYGLQFFEAMVGEGAIT